MAVTRTHFRFRIDVWTANSESIVGHVAGIEDYLGTFRLACERWPRVPITLRHGARVGAHHISALYEYDLPWVRDGGLMSYGPDLQEFQSGGAGRKTRQRRRRG